MATLGAGVPDVIAARIAATVALAQKLSSETEGRMREQAPWRDRTAAARVGLTSVVHVQRGQTHARIVIDSGHSVEYGVLLEEGHPPHVITPKTAKALAFTVNGQTVFAKRVQHPGVPKGKYAVVEPVALAFTVPRLTAGLAQIWS